MISFRIEDTIVEILGEYVHISKDDIIISYKIGEDKFLAQFIPGDWNDHADRKHWYMEDYVTEQSIQTWQLDNEHLIEEL